MWKGWRTKSRTTQNKIRCVIHHFFLVKSKSFLWWNQNGSEKSYRKLKLFFTIHENKPSRLLFTAQKDSITLDVVTYVEECKYFYSILNKNNFYETGISTFWYFIVLAKISGPLSFGKKERLPFLNFMRTQTKLSEHQIYVLQSRILLMLNN